MGQCNNVTISGNNGDLLSLEILKLSISTGLKKGKINVRFFRTIEKHR